MSITDSGIVDYRHEIKCYRCNLGAEYIEWDLKYEEEIGRYSRVGMEIVCLSCVSRRFKESLETVLFCWGDERVREFMDGKEFESGRVRGNIRRGIKRGRGLLWKN